MGYVYLLIQVDDVGREVYKVGVTKRNIDSRIRELKTGNPYSVDLLASYESNNYLRIEKWIHRKYFHAKTIAKNEWFNLTNEQVMSFLVDCKKADETISILLTENPFYK